MKQWLINFVKSGESEYNFPNMVPLSEVDEILKEMGFEAGEWDSNGWQVDFWQDYTHNEYGEYQMIGSLFYGEFKLVKIQ